MERLFLRERTEETFVRVFEKQKIGVVGMNGGVGTSFVATSLAKMLSSDGIRNNRIVEKVKNAGSGANTRNVTYLEVCDRIHNKKSFIYDSIGFDKRFKTREFTRFYSDITKGKNIKGKVNSDEKINWALITPEDIKDEISLKPIEMIRLVNNIFGDVIVCDITECKNAEDYLLDMDVIIFVIDPIPSGMIAGYPFLREVKRMEYNGKKVVWLVNKYNLGINKRDMQNFLKLKEYYKIPAMDISSFYSAEYNCKLPYETPDIKEKTIETFEKILSKELGML